MLRIEKSYPQKHSTLSHLLTRIDVPYMLHFWSLHLLFWHSTILQKLLDQEDIFVVWWAVRDLLLGITTDPKDIDITLSWNPDIIRESMNFDPKMWSRFRTEKFGTMTFLPKHTVEIDGGSETEIETGVQRSDTDADISTWVSGSLDTKEESAVYELTPFRTESEYTDNRHPDEVIRSDSLLDDASRRDFTINALYWIWVHIKASDIKLSSPSSQIKNESKLIQLLVKEKNICVSSSVTQTKTLILQDYDTIQKLFPTWRLDKDILRELLKKTKQYISPIWLTPLPSPDPQSKHEISEDHVENHAPNQENTVQLSILLDPTLWLQDCIHHNITTVWDPNKRFKEDALRIVRGVRFVNILNQKLPDTHLQNSWYDIEKVTRNSMKLHAPLVQNLAGERLHAEITKVFSHHNPFWYIALLRELDLLKTIFPSVHKTLWNIQPIKYHPFDTYNHTILTLHALQTYLSESHETNKHNDSDTYIPTRIDLIQLAMLYHDVGKPEQYDAFEQEIAKNPDDPDRSAFVHHTESGVSLALTDLKKLCFPKKDIEEICRYIRRHHRPGEILQSSEKKQHTKVRKLLSDGGKQRCINLISMAIADRRWQFNPLQSPAIAQLEEMKETIIRLDTEEWRFLPKHLQVNGNDIMTVHSLQPWPIIWKIVEKVFDHVLWDVNERNSSEKIHEYVKQILPKLREETHH